MMIIQEGTMGRVGLTGCAREWSATCSAAKVLAFYDEPDIQGWGEWGRPGVQGNGVLLARTKVLAGHPFIAIPSS